MREVISVKNGITRMPEWRLAEPVNFVLNDNEHIAVIGKNGSGKSMLIDIITGRHPLILNEPVYNFEPSKKKLVSDNIKYITFKDSYGDNDATYYLQQRWNQHDIDEDTPKVQELLEEAYHMYGEDTIERRYYQTHLYKLLDIEHLLDKYIILLSSGELRKFQLIKALLSQPRVLIIDNPFIGLDNDTRLQLKDLLSLLAHENNIQIILVLSKISDIPDFITHVVEVCDMKVNTKLPLNEYLSKDRHATERMLSRDHEYAILNLPYKENKFCSKKIIKMTNVNIRYGNRIILKDINWVVFNGEKWALCGKNGAGKSTLLSLVCADNPQSYACNIALFGQQRGNGESIWDIKRHIGYVSPEMHRAYKHNIPTIRVVASGLKDSVGLYAKPSENDYKICKWWMKIFNIEKLADRPFLMLSSGEQRLALLTRAFVKDPELLILDEPFHGLDDSNRQLATEIIETFCKRKNKTLIIVSHYLNELPKCVTKKLFLKRSI